MPTLVTPEQRQAAKREIIWQVEQGATASHDGLSATQAGAE